MKKLKLYLFIALMTILLLCIISCTHRTKKINHENGVVVELQYFPDTRQIVTGTSYSSNGEVIITNVLIGQDEKCIVIFKCANGVIFSVNNVELYNKLNKGDHVIIDYAIFVDDAGKINEREFINATTIK